MIDAMVKLVYFTACVDALVPHVGLNLHKCVGLRLDSNRIDFIVNDTFVKKRSSILIYNRFHLFTALNYLVKMKVD